MKEISLQDLLNMADRAAHDGICDLWNQKTIHYLVLFTSPDQDFEIIGAGPTLPCATLEDAEKHQIPGKTPELYVKCPAALAGKLQPKLAPKHLGASMPTLKGKTAIPFTKPAIKLSPKPAPAAATETKPVETPAPAAPASTPPAAKSATPSSGTDELAPRLAAIAQREGELAALATALKSREMAVKQREDAATAREEKLLQRADKPS